MALDRVLHYGEPLRTVEEVMAMRVEEAQAVIQWQTDKLTAALHARGYEKAQAQIWVGHGAADLTIYIAEKPAEFGSYLYGDDLVSLLLQAHERIAAMPDASAYDAEFSAPLYLYSQHAEAAE
jgi:hypothetical protein